MSIVIDTPEGLAFLHLLQLRGALRIEIATGMRHSGGSVLKAANRHLGTNFTRKTAAVNHLTDLIDAALAARSQGG